MDVLATTRGGQQKLRMITTKSKSHPIPEWIPVNWRGRTLLSVSLPPSLPLALGLSWKKEWAVWLQRPWADSWASVFGCTWQVNFFLSLRFYEGTTVKCCIHHKIFPLPDSLGFPSHLTPRWRNTAPLAAGKSPLISVLVSFLCAQIK